MAWGGFAAPPCENRGPGLAARRVDGGHEERRRDRGVRARGREEAHVHEGPALDPREVDGQDVLRLEPLGGLADALAGQEVGRGQPLLGEEDVDRVAHGHLEPAGGGQALHQLLGRGLDQRLPQASQEGQEHDADLAGGDPEAVTRLDLDARRRRRHREALLRLGDPGEAERVLGAAEHLAGPRMLDLPSLAKELHVQAGAGSRLGSRAERERAGPDLEHLALELGEQVQELLDQRGHRGRAGRAREAAWARPATEPTRSPPRRRPGAAAVRSREDVVRYHHSLGEAPSRLERSAPRRRSQPTTALKVVGCGGCWITM